MALNRTIERVLRPLLFAAGCVFVVIGVAGLFLPLLPGTVFLIAAAACFARSSPRFEAWLLDHPQFGPGIRGWRETGSIPLQAKFIAIGAMMFSFVLTALSGAPPVALWCTGIILTGVAIYIATRPTTRR